MSTTKVTAYYDASGQEGAEETGLRSISWRHPTNLIELAGVVGTDDDWAQFDARWTAALAAENIREFHHTDYKGSKGEFAEWKGDEPRRIRLMDALLTVFEECTKAWYTVGIDQGTFDMVNEVFVLDPKTGPFLLAAQVAKVVVDGR